MATDGSYEIVMTLKLQGHGRDEQAIETMANVLRFVKLDVLPNTEVMDAMILRDGRGVIVQPSSIPERHA